jgi:hypothetical protein
MLMAMRADAAGNGQRPGAVGTRSLVAKWIRAHRQGLPAPVTVLPLPGSQTLVM